MLTRYQIESELPNLDLAVLQAYLRNTGWERIETPKSNIALFYQQVGGSHFETVLPLDNGFGDYPQRILDVLESISAVEQRSIEQVLTDLSLPAR